MGYVDNRLEPPAPDPRIEPGQCGASRALGGNPFVCIKAPHNDASPEAAYKRVWRGKRPLADFHFFIRQYPDA